MNLIIAAVAVGAVIVILCLWSIRLLVGISINQDIEKLLLLGSFKDICTEAVSKGLLTDDLRLLPPNQNFWGPVKWGTIGRVYAHLLSGSTLRGQTCFGSPEDTKECQRDAPEWLEVAKAVGAMSPTNRMAFLEALRAESPGTYEELEIYLNMDTIGRHMTELPKIHIEPHI